MSNTEFVSYVFGGVGLLYLAAMGTYLLVRRREDWPPPAASYILGFLCAIAGGFCTYFFSGQLELNFEVPFTNIRGDAAGSIGVFVLVLLLWFRFDARERARIERARIAKEEEERRKRKEEEERKKREAEAAQDAAREAARLKAAQTQKEQAANSLNVLAGRGGRQQ